MIAFQGLSKRYGTFDAVHPLTLQVGKGEVFGFLGPNGAGKTTTIRMLMGILVPSAGRVLVDGLDCQRDGAAVSARWAICPTIPSFTIICGAAKSCNSWPKCMVFRVRKRPRAPRAC